MPLPLSFYGKQRGTLFLKENLPVHMRRGARFKKRARHQCRRANVLTEVRKYFNFIHSSLVRKLKDTIDFSCTTRALLLW